MSKEMAQTLFQNTEVPLGVRVEFFYQWSRWIKTINQTSSDSNEIQLTDLASQESETPGSIAPSTQKNPSSIEDSLKLETILKSNIHGKALVDAYKQTHTMNENLRKLLLESVLQYCIEHDHELTVSDSALLSNQICAAFPGELMVFHPSNPSFIFQIISQLNNPLSQRSLISVAYYLTKVFPFLSHTIILNGKTRHHLENSILNTEIGKAASFGKRNSRATRNPRATRKE